MRYKTLLLISSFGELALLFSVLRSKDCASTLVLVFDNEDLFTFLDNINGRDFAFGLTFVARFSKRNVYKPLNYLRERAYYKSELKALSVKIEEVSEVHCFSIYQNHYCFQVILRNDFDCVHIYSPVVCEVTGSVVKRVANLGRVILNKCVYGKEFTSLATDHKNFDVVSSRFLASLKDNYHSRDECNEIKRTVEIDAYYMHNHAYRVIFFDQPLINYGRVGAAEFSEFMKDIRITFAKFIEEGELAVKLHPGNHTHLNYYVGLNIIGGEIPSQCLQCDENQLWISVSSQSIWTESRPHRISLVNLLSFSDETVKTAVSANFKETSEGDIFMPESFDSLRAYVSKWQRM